MFRIKSILSLLFARYVIHNNKKWKNNAIIYQEKIMRHLVNSARDINFDKKRLKTLPILFGVERSKKIALIMLLFFLIFEFFHYVVFSWEINFFLASLLCFGYTYYLIKKSGMDRNKFYYSFLVESCSISLVVFLIITAIFL